MKDFRDLLAVLIITLVIAPTTAIVAWLSPEMSTRYFGTVIDALLQERRGNDRQKPI